MAAGRALVVTRRDPATPADGVALGIRLPDTDGGTRVAVIAARRDVVRSAPPLALAEVAAHFRSSLRRAFGELIEAGTANDTSFSVFGSYAWQVIAGAPSTTPRSDLDLVWIARGREHVARIAAVFADWERRHGMAVDGEAICRCGGAVAWRELFGNSERMLVKRDGGVAIERSPLQVP